MHVMCMSLVLTKTNIAVEDKQETIVETIKVEASLGRKTWNFIVVIRRDISRKIVIHEK